MAVAQPNHLLVFNESSGTTVTQYGTLASGYTIQQGTSPTNWEWFNGAGPYLSNGYLQGKTTGGSSSMPYLSSAATAPSAALANINVMAAFRVTGYSDGIGIICSQNGTNDGDARISVVTGTGDFDLVCLFDHDGNAPISTTFTGLSFGVNYIVAMSLDVSTPTAVQARFKLGAGSVVSPATANWNSFGMRATWPYIWRRNDFTTNLAPLGRIYAFAYGRGQTVWSSTDLGDITAAPDSAITGWPGAVDTTPDAFTFTDQTAVALSTLRTSNTVTITGINAASAVSITGGEWQKNGGSWGSGAGTVVVNDTVAVRHTSSGTDATAVNTTLTIGGVSDTFTSTTGDSTPTAFSFTDATAVALSTLQTSNTLTLAGTNIAAAISITGGEYQVNGGAWTTSAGTIAPGSTFAVRHTSSGSQATATNTVLTIGGVSDTFTSTTLDTVPNAFSFTDQTNVAVGATITSGTLTVAGITAAAAVSIVGGEWQKNGGAWGTSAGTVVNGDTFAVRHTSSGTARVQTNTTLTIGGVSDTFSSTTGHFRSAASASSDTSGQKTVTVSKPAGAISGDVLIADINDCNSDAPNATGSITSPGWTVIGTPVNSGGSGFTKVTRLRRVIRADSLNGNNVASEPNTYVFTTSYGGVTYRVVGAIAAYVGIDPNTNEDVTSAYQFNSGASTNIQAATLTPVTAAGTVLVTGYAGGSGENLSPTDTATVPGSQVRRIKQSENNGDVFVVLADEPLTGTSATGTRTATWPVSTTSFGISTLLRVATGGLGVSSVSSDNTVNAGELAAAIVGTGFGATQGTGGVSIIQGSVTLAQTVVGWADALVTFNAVFEQTGADFFYGNATLRLTINGGSFVDVAVVLAPALGNIFVTLATPDPVNAIQTTPPLVAGDQVEARGFLGNAAPSGLSIGTDAVPVFSGNSNHFQLRVWDVSDGTWGAWEFWLDTRLILGIDPINLAVTGVATDLEALRVIGIAQASIVLTLQPVTLTYQSGALEPMGLAITLQAVTLRVARRLAVDTLALTLTLPDINAADIIAAPPVGREPLPPQQVLILAQTPQGVTLQWPTQVDHGGSGLAGFNVYRDFQKVNAAPVLVGSYTDDPPGDAARRYRYHVTTVALNGMESPASPFVEVQTETRPLSFRITPLGGIEWKYD